MFWVDNVVSELNKRKLPLECVDDAKTPSGRIHVGSLRGIVVHDLVYKALKSAGVNAKYTYIFDNHDPMDALPNYLPKEKFEKYLGLPLFKVPSPEKGFNNYAEYYAFEFKNVFNKIGCNPEILWTADLYKSGKMNPLIKECLDKAPEIRKIYGSICGGGGGNPYGGGQSGCFGKLFLKKSDYLSCSISPAKSCKLPLL